MIYALENGLKNKKIIELLESMDRTVRRYVFETLQTVQISIVKSGGHQTRS